MRAASGGAAPTRRRPCCTSATAASPATSARARGDAARAPPAMDVVARVAKPGLASAAANSAAEPNRSAGSFSSAVQHRRLDLRRNGVPLAGERAGLLRDHARHDGLRRAAGERRVARQHFIEHAAQGIHIRARGNLPLAHRLLGAHVVRRAEAHAGLGHPGAGGAHRQRDAEVGHQRRAVVQQDVLGLDVAVDDAVAVGVVQRARRPRWRSAPRRPPGAASRG